MTKSALWNHVRMLNETKVQCNYCPQTLKNNKSITAFWTHFKKHNIFNGSANDEAASGNERSAESSAKHVTTKMQNFLKLMD